ncbi:O-acetyl-ADP-ribose deacetylase (regulator of RNase III), contains Macro domain [Chryseobacterium rhizoplanae]|uniref:O-acetyl-ADP-ribose deacetylase (Regulator of RNase III), contains Macro domain n=1 Tax=Chryseobacterium rhizoplanae TaxID=1609531 RepID=A0A521C918_9FLAO|nr:O-acetyl-ADP-ribose deacetylase (regulator of RNase III), contains Macro domain [Chryseobacterium rhizoplanae]
MIETITMKIIQYVKGDATRPNAEGNIIIAHICNDIGGWGKGFVLAVSKRWEAPEKEYRNWHRLRSKNNFALGEIQLVQVEKYIYIANIIGQKGIKTGSNGVPVRYDAIEKALEKLSDEALQLNASIHMPRIGCGLAGGKWEEIEPIIERTLLAKNVEVYVYDFE